MGATATVAATAGRLALVALALALPASAAALRHDGGPMTVPVPLASGWGRWSGGSAGAVRSLPPHLVPCYSDPALFRRESRLPFTMANLVDLVQRVERDPGFVADLRVTVTSLLRRFRVDGLERNPLVQAKPGVTPYRLTGLQHARHNVLAAMLLPGNANLLPGDTLTAQQQCTLHWMLSSAVDPWERGDEHSICPRMPTPRSGATPAGGNVKVNVNINWPGHRLYPDPVRDVGPWGGVNVSPPPPPDEAPNSWSACPVEDGVVEVDRGGGGGGVAAGAVLAGLAAGLQPQEVPLASLLSPRHLEQLRADGGSASDTVDNLWAATLAGDLAEVAAYQGPSAAGAGTSSLVVGPAGVWNDPVIPRVRYLSRERPGSPELAPVQHWEMTDAEIRGDFDGLALGGRVAHWAEQSSRVRLSQLLDMYYSPRGVPFNGEGVRACKRGDGTGGVFAPNTLFTQTTRFARTLTDASPDAPYMTESALRNFTTASVRAFLRYAGDLLVSDACDSPPLMAVRANAIVVLDTTWERADALQFITRLAGGEGIDVGLFGSRIAVMNGGVGGLGAVGGHWIVNFTDSPVQVATDWAVSDAADELWPTYLDLPWTLMAVVEHLRSKAEAESANGSVGATHGDVVVIVAAASTVSDADLRHSKLLLSKIKYTSPDVKMMYVVTESGETRFQELATLSADWEDVVIVVDDIAPDAVAQAVANYLHEIPGRLMPAECVLAQGGTPAPGTPQSGTPKPPPRAKAGAWPVQQGAHVGAAAGVRRRWGSGRGRGPAGLAGATQARAELEDYVSPGQLRLYRIDTAYTRRGVPVSVQLVGEDYGELRMCMWRAAASGGPLAAMRAALRAEEAGGDDADVPETPQADCVNMAGFGEANVTIIEPCRDRCAPLYVSVTASRSSFKCTEDDCRYPDEVRYLLRPRGVVCAGALPSTGGSPALASTPSTAIHGATLALQLLLLLAAR